MTRGADRVIVALDVTALPSALAMARRLRGLVRTLKVGSALFTACGPVAIERIRALGFEVMLDLKFFDIPSTVELSCRAAARHHVAMLTVHAAGGPAMLEAAVRGVREEAGRLRVRRPRVLGVTVLTSVGAARPASVRATVLALAGSAVRAGCDGVVASAQEAAALRKRFGRQLMIVCPGIRPVGGVWRATSSHDQRRMGTPAQALMNGADRLVIGRPITAARDPRAAAQHLLKEIAQC